MNDLLTTKLEMKFPSWEHQNKEERFAVYRYLLNLIGSCSLISLLLMMPELDLAFSWVKG